LPGCPQHCIANVARGLGLNVDELDAGLEVLSYIGGTRSDVHDKAGKSYQSIGGGDILGGFLNRDTR
jgi:hypothetical protein